MKNSTTPQNKSSFYYKIIIALLVVIVLLLLFRKNGSTDQPPVKPVTDPTETHTRKEKKEPVRSNSIDQLTASEVVVPYVKEHKRLPEYYVTKKQARQQGWNPSAGNLCDVLPGKAIGGDIFTNREGRLPDANGRKWFEADLNYNCGNRNADRLLFSNDGLVFVTSDHYQTFVQQ